MTVTSGADSPFFFTWSAQRNTKPMDIVGGRGAFFDTADGARWLDLGSLIYQANLGHGHPRMIAAIQKQAGELALTIPNANFPAKEALARRLLELCGPGYSKVFFTLGGAESNENALKIARMVTGRFKAIARYRSYHGASMGALSLTGDWRRPPLEPGLPGVIHAQDCYCDRCPFGQKVESCKRECATHIDELMELEGSKTVGAVFLEPIPGANGVLVPPDGYWKKIREACDRQGALLVADEVLCGFGRTGKWFGFQHEGVTPDLITMAKGLTAGYGTLGAVVVHERVAKHFDDRVLLAGLTGYAHPVSCATALEALRVYEDEKLIENAAALGHVLLDRMRSWQTRFPGTVEFVRGRGLLAGAELRLDPAAFQRFSDGLAQRHVLTHLYARTRMIILTPPLCITRAELDDGLTLVEAALAQSIGATA